MAILTREEYLKRIQDMIGDDASDESVSFLEDLTDTYNDLETRANGDGNDWKEKYEENDKAWKKRYMQRFFSGNGYSQLEDETTVLTPDEIALEKAENITVDELFEEKE